MANERRTTFMKGQRVAFSVTGTKGETLERCEGFVSRLFKNGKVAVVVGQFAPKTYNVPACDLAEVQS